MLIGNKVFIIDLAKKQVREDVIIDISISSTGYLLYGFRDGVAFESALVFETKEQAEAIKDTYFGLREQMKQLAKSCNEQMDALRCQIIGEPQFKDLINDK